MNERIQELKDKIWTEEYWTNPNTDKLLPAQLNRFAELIVLECASFARAYTLKKSGIENPYTGAVFIEDEIKKHFGIEK